MINEEVNKIIKDEGLKRFNLYNEHSLKENEVGIRKSNNNQWEVYVTDERANIVQGSITAFDNESDALDNFIKRLRTEVV
ncbi:Imm59 family immunity protein [Bacillus sp. USDA818B3_A]|uniref:Imm59 family immunity protein n=1 Tax=Bacillus sp. USDA818B3_A TaxID=2698834 RepID=UPI00136A581E|nr:Imm59 family immunity protein [Bacillus sp. USDA818B3_A]